MPRLLTAWVVRCLRIARLLLASLGLIVVIVLATPLTYRYARVLASPSNDPQGDIMIVLSGEDSFEGILGDNTYLRCMYAVLAFRTGSFRQVLVSGGDTAMGMRDFLVYHGIPSTLILVDSRSTTTRESALLIPTLLAGVRGRKLLVTSDYHAFRARRAFHRAGLDVMVFAFPDAAKRSGRLLGRMPAFINEAVETTKIAYYFTRGWI